MDTWELANDSIKDPELLGRIRTTLEARGPLVVEWRHYRGGRAPTRVILVDYEEFLELLRSRSTAGDAIFVWSYEERCKSDSAIAWGKVPNERGETPVGGAY